MKNEPLKEEMLEPHGTTLKVLVDDYKSPETISRRSAVYTTNSIADHSQL